MKPKVATKTKDVAPKDAWLTLAADVLIFAIADVRQTKNVPKREKAKAWLLSPAAALFFDEILDPKFDVEAWVKANCPELDK
jgi:hypothetical protein